MRINELKLNAHNSLSAVVIDPIARTVTAMRVPSDFDLLKSHVLGCRTAEVVDLGEGCDAWIDEEGTFGDWQTVGVTKLGGNLQLFGVIVIVGRDAANDMADVPDHVPVDMIASMCQWPPVKNVKVKGSTLTTFDAAGSPTTVKLSGDRVYEGEKEILCHLCNDTGKRSNEMPCDCAAAA